LLLSGFDFRLTVARGRTTPTLGVILIGAGFASTFGVFVGETCFAAGLTQPTGSLTSGFAAPSFGGDLFFRQFESLTTRFLGALAILTSSSSLLCTGVGFFPDFSGLAVLSVVSTPFFGVARAPSGVGFGDSFTGVSFVFPFAVTLMTTSASSSVTMGALGSSTGMIPPPSVCHFLILCLMFAFSWIPIAFPKSSGFFAEVSPRARFAAARRAAGESAGMGGGIAAAGGDVRCDALQECVNRRGEVCDCDCRRRGGECGVGAGGGGQTTREAK
jgi:hypothetical protein